MILEEKNEKKTDKVTDSVTESCDMESHFNTPPTSMVKDLPSTSSVQQA